MPRGKGRGRRTVDECARTVGERGVWRGRERKRRRGVRKGGVLRGSRETNRRGWLRVRDCVRNLRT